ncbi:hypothetical protein MB84_27705 (plasmid) [Pandoraea oxalativorans]|uniref:Uncharacterized protein n=1 Tax=Pandoraea oxalativorans TaxID=573737 RepID=A0A0G3IDF2_9BURK|nr:hypothetical protein MB84_27705 [Pandoraea oxalativorans]
MFRQNKINVHNGTILPRGYVLLIIIYIFRTIIFACQSIILAQQKFLPCDNCIFMNFSVY